MYQKHSNPNSNANRHHKVALKTTCIKNVKFQIIKIRIGYQKIYFYYSENLNWAARNLQTGPHAARTLDTAVLKPCFVGYCVCLNNILYFLVPL